jgi:aquaporin Z
MINMSQQNLRKYTMEGLGTFFLVLTIGCCSIFSAASIAAAALVTALVYVGGPLSGGHYNPAVTFGIWMRGSLDKQLVLPYFLSQIGGALAAAVLIRFSFFQPEVVATQLSKRLEMVNPFSPHHMLIAEFLFTFALVFVILEVATNQVSRGNQYFGLAIGFTLLAGALSAGTISGAVFNPAVALSLPLMGLSTWTNLWVYVVGTFAGGAAAAVVYNFLHPQI